MKKINLRKLLKNTVPVICIISLTVFSSENLYAQVGISTTSITADPSSVLELRSTTLGFLPPRMTTTQRDAITSPATGLLIYNTTTSQLNYYTGSVWQVVTGGGQAQLNGTGFVKASGTTISYDNTTYINSTDKGANNGVASLDGSGKVPISQLAVGAQIYKGTWNASTNSPAVSDATGQSGWTYRVVVGGTINLGSGNITFSANDDAIYNGTIWQRNPATNAVTTVNGQSGTVVLNSDQVTQGSTNKYYSDSLANLKVNVTDKGANNGVATLDGGGKVPVSQLPVGSQSYKGTWNASTNTPTIADGSGTSGWTYRVATAGSQNLGSGSISFSAGDDVIYNGSVWQKSTNSSSVTSVNTQTGNVVLTTDNVNEGSTNLYFTNARVESLLSANSPLSYNSSSGVFSISQATSSVNGYLSFTDWVTFNQKQAAGNYVLDPGGNGIMARTSLNTSIYRTLTGTSNRLSITNGDGVSGNPTFDISSSYVGQSSITTLGTIGTGIWNGTLITSAYGGTGNGFTKFSGPATSEKTFTLPNASANILTDNAAVTVAQGGTGVASTTAYGVITGGTTSTGAFQNAGTGTTGQVLTSNGSSALPTWQMATGELIKVRFITSGTTYTPTTGTKTILIEMVGGGGGGGGAIIKGSVGAGGGAGGYIKTYVTGISDASTYTIAIGAGGAGGVATGGGSGSAGGATTFTTLAGSTPANTTFTCNGGGGGTGSNSGSTKVTDPGGAGGTSTNGDLSAGGAPGGWTVSRGNAEGSSAGAGGSSQFGGGGVGVVALFTTTDLPGNAGSGKGAGGGGAYAGTNTGTTGGAGSGGIIIIYEYK